MVKFSVSKDFKIEYYFELAEYELTKALFVLLTNFVKSAIEI